MLEQAVCGSSASGVLFGMAKWGAQQLTEEKGEWDAENNPAMVQDSVHRASMTVLRCSAGCGTPLPLDAMQQHAFVESNAQA